MVTPHLHVLAIDPGGTTGWAHFIIPRKSMFGNEPSEVLDWGTGEIYGSEDEQAIKIARMAREIQSLSYRIGPAVVIEDFDFGAPFRDKAVYSPVRIAAKIKLLHHMGLMDDSRVVMQSRSIAKEHMTDERLRMSGFWVPGPDHQRDAVRHALTVLRRAKQKHSIRDKLWDPKYAIV